MTRTRTPDALDVPIPAELLDDPPLDPEAVSAALTAAAVAGVAVTDLVDDAGERAADLVVPSSAVEVARWRPADDSAAEWLARLRAAAAAEQRAAEEQATIWREQIDRWQAQRTAEPARTQAWATALLAEYGAGERTAGGRTQVALPSATIKTRAKNVGGRIDVVDDEAVIEWAEGRPTAEYEAVIKTTRKVVLAELRKRLRIKPADGDAPAQVVDEDGEVVPGVTVEPESFDVSVS